MRWTNELEISKWTTKVFVNGPIEIEKEISFKSRKDIESGSQLMSNIKITNTGDGVILKVDSFASELKYGKKAALIFSGLALDVLSMKINCPLYVRLYDKIANINFNDKNIQRTVTEEEWRFAFKESRLLTFTAPTFLRALGWYRKGLLSDDPMDKFLAFWNSIEVVAGKYHTRNPRTKSGIINQIWQCFLDLWGTPENWKVIPNQENWINENCETRQDVAHGLIAIDLDSIEIISNKIVIIEKLAHQFLVDWRIGRLNPEGEIDDTIREKLDEEKWIKIEQNIQ